MREKLSTATAAAWVVVLAAVLCATVGKAHIDGGPLWDAAVHARREVRLAPLLEFRELSTVWYGPWVNLLGNIALFYPVGFLAYRRPLTTGFLLSLAIETTQFATYSGYSDIDDLIFNTLGAGLGGWAANRVGDRARTIVLALLVVGCAAIVGIFAALAVWQRL
ncbi:VanZ family protein [Corynebacterium mayonis]|uniref:VanZ family protein n=1 Tax=Corynebacterium mayonis TaxID=3062461 RepID=UPI003140969A